MAGRHFSETVLFSSHSDAVDINISFDFDGSAIGKQTDPPYHNFYEQDRRRKLGVHWRPAGTNAFETIRRQAFLTAPFERRSGRTNSYERVHEDDVDCSYWIARESGKHGVAWINHGSMGNVVDDDSVSTVLAFNVPIDMAGKTVGKSSSFDGNLRPWQIKTLHLNERTWSLW